jgi:predicted P-loop ATPase
VLDYLDECQGKWDGKKRIDTWVIDYLGCEDTPLNRAIGRLMLIASVQRARLPGCKFDQICVLEGEEGRDKSTAIRVLAGDETFSDQSVLNVSDLFYCMFAQTHRLDRSGKKTSTAPGGTRSASATAAFRGVICLAALPDVSRQPDV